MLEFLSKLFDSSDFPPRWHCGNWSSGHGWLHIGSDVATWAAYMAIPCVLGYFVMRRRDVPFPRIFWLFCVFIFACGAVHLVEASMFWWPAYRVSGVLKLTTAVASWATVLALIPIMPKAVALRSPTDLEQLNLNLASEMHERTQAEEALRNSEALYHSLVETVPLSVFRKDPQGRFVFGNQAFCRALGRPREEILGRTDFDFFPRELAEKYQHDDRQVIEERHIKEDVEAHQSPTGEKLYVEVVKTPVYDFRGQVVGSQGIFWDVTARRLAEERLKATAAELKRSNKELETFASIASHDLQEPLRKVQAFGDRLKAKCGNSLSDDGRDYLERMQNAAGRMRTLINDLLTFSRVTTRGQPFVPVNLSELVGEVLSDLEVRIEQSGATVEVGSLPTIDADPTQMRQLFQNLISNALKFRRPEESPRVEIDATFRDSAELANGLCIISFRDNGIGFDSKHAQRIFGVFQRLHGRDEYEGTGIGLAVCQKIAVRHGGIIEAESAPGQGATFRVTLPVRHGNEESDHADNEQPNDHPAG